MFFQMFHYLNCLRQYNAENISIENVFVRYYPGQ
jgi:hypothetical protein